MEFAVSDVDSMYIWPMTFQNSMYFSRGLFEENGTWKINPRAQRDAKNFANIWLKNIAWQQSVKIGVKHNALVS